jgi:parallel beta-helix repeat protein
MNVVQRRLNAHRSREGHARGRCPDFEHEEETNMMTTRPTIALALALALAAGLVATASAAHAQVACGDTITKGQTVTLTADVGPCDGVENAIIVDSGILDLGGRTVSCADTNTDGEVPYGIYVRGKKAQVRNGTVSGCLDNVWIGGDGKHTIEGITTTAAEFDGFFVASSSPKNRFTGNTATANKDDGFEVRGSKNTIESNVASNNGEDGIDLPDASKNKVNANTTADNADDGIEATGPKNKITGNTSTGNGVPCAPGKSCFGIAVGDKKNKVLGNTATGNGTADIVGQEPCTQNKFKDNTFGTGSSCVK